MDIGAIIGVVGSIIGVCGIVSAFIDRRKLKPLQDNRQQVHNQAQNIQQNNYFATNPNALREQIDTIITSTATDTTDFKFRP